MSMEVPSSSPIYTPLKPRPRRVIEQVEPVTLFASDLDAAPPQNSRPREQDEPDTQITHAAREESVICSSEEELNDTDGDVTHVEDELHWSFAQRPPPPEAKPMAVIEDSILGEEPLELPGVASSPWDDAGEETILTDDEGQHTDSDLAVGIYESQPKSTQNYLSELLTESLLESLPLPPDRKQHLRDVAR